MIESAFAATLFYDGHCAFCKRIMNIINFFDSKKLIRQIDLWEVGLYPEFKDLDHTNLIKEIHLVTASDKVYTGYFAFKFVAKKVPAFFMFWLLSFIPGIDFIGNKIYSLVSENRYRLGCSSCGKLYCRIHTFPPGT